MKHSDRIVKLRDALLDAQAALRTAPHAGSVVLIVTGIPAAGRSETVHQLLDWLDPKFVTVHALRRPDASQRERPALWRYWIRLPPGGRIAIFFGAWYGDILLPVRDARGTARTFDAVPECRALARIRRLETMLRRDGVQVVKVHLHIDRRTQRKRLRALRASTLTRWRVKPVDLWLARHHAAVRRLADRCIRATHRPGAPWHVIDGSDGEARALTVGRVLLRALRRAKEPAVTARTARRAPAVRRRHAATPAAFKTHQEGPDVSAEAYRRALQVLQGRFALLTRRRAFARRSAVLAFEGMDAAGKGGAIKRLAQALDARVYQVVPVGAPSPTEQRYPWLWRFWRHLPRRGEIAFFDRSWYGRVLVERVRSLTPAVDWQRAYAEIREFERQLAEHGIVVHKFWLAVSREEQLRRFRKRDADPLKRFKVDPEDWVNRRHFAAYERAAQEAIARTHARHAPWSVIEADDKRHARLAVLRAVCERLERTLDAGA
ncbi:MAG: polyphosphate:AMP phosphotransferase [Proteobacteria bacterium]|nr:MAG: polyphosphate:AMP phosphotransferase [Pseudomonadota bacterium]